MKKKFVLIAAVVVFMIALPAILGVIGFFKVDKRVHTNKLVIEGWMDHEAVEHPTFPYNSYDTIFTVGIKQPEQWHLVSEAAKSKSERNYLHKKDGEFIFLTNGFIFLRNYEDMDLPDTVTSVKIVAKGTPADGQNAHFFLSVKDSVIDHTFVNEDVDTFKFKVHVPSDQLEFLNLYFNNDMDNGSEDINLFVYDIIVNDISVLLSEDKFLYLKASEYNLFSSQAVRTANYLRSIPDMKAKIITVDTLFVGRNRTLVAATAFANYLRKHKITLPALNIYTLDAHSRRTKLAYGKRLDSSVTIGMIPAKNYDEGPFRLRKIKSWYVGNLKEFVSWFGTLLSF